MDLAFEVHKIFLIQPAALRQQLRQRHRLIVGANFYGVGQLIETDEPTLNGQNSQHQMFLVDVHEDRVTGLSVECAGQDDLASELHEGDIQS